MKKRLASEKDYTTAQLPHTRREVFSDICRLYGGNLIRTGLILLAFALPLLVVGYIVDENELMYLTMVQGADAFTEKLCIYQEFQTINVFFSLLNIVGYTIFSIGFSGAARVIRQHAWEEPVNLKLDLLKGIRQNGKAYLLLGIMTGGWGLITRYCLEGAAYMQGGWRLLSLFPLLIGVFVFLPVLGFAVVCNAIYANSFGQNLRISVVLYLKKPIVSAGGGLLMAVLPLLPVIVPSIPLRLLMRAAVILISPFLLLIWFLWCCCQLDIFINPEHHPELIGRGLVSENAEE